MNESHKKIVEMIPHGSSVLDLGCGEGELLYHLINEKGVKGQGIEINEKHIYKCVEKGLDVFHDDLDNGLVDYNDASFDFVIMNEALQEVRFPEKVLNEALRVGKSVIVGFPNFAHLSARLELFFCGRAPVTPALPHQWYDTPNLHFLSVKDFKDYCKTKKITIVKEAYLPDAIYTRLFPNLFSEKAIIIICKKHNT
ncbi:MAG: methionine biosynthesis protein MetW [Thermodesulfovibrionales bacterium]|nr:methionine biosynthesis protein MetW [Thermodesulfovibrionales bacterium]